jgi:Predicted nucleoside-diphosphate-sugar epimerases
MSFVVTGATGHFGRHAIDALLSRGVPAEQIVAAGRSIEKLDDLAARGVRVVRIDYAEPETLTAAFAGAEALLFVSSSDVGRRIAQHANVVAAAKDAAVGRIVYTSAPHADASALVLAPEHKATEQLIRESGIPFTLLRNNWYTENYVSTLEQARQSGTVVASAGAGRVASASRADYADAAAVVLTDGTHADKIYELSGDVAWGFTELAGAIADIIGRDVAYAPVTPEEHLAILTAAGLDEGTAAFVVALDGNIRDGALAEASGTLSALIGRPTTPLEEGLRAAIGA